MTHSPEPWHIDRGHRCREIQDHANNTVILCANHIDWIDELPAEAQPDDSDRIVACVNFCRQFPTEHLIGRQLVYIKSADDIGDRHSDGFVACTLIPIQKDQTNG